ncbi:MAG: aldo/keto reductase, partial [Candidatus Omnitrophota bacterium]
MRYRKIGKTDLGVSSICLGSWVFGGDCWGEVNDAQSVDVVRGAIEKGVNFIDTAPIYGSGRSEEVIGKAIRGRRDKVIIATKMGLEQKGSSIRPN